MDGWIKFDSIYLQDQCAIGPLGSFDQADRKKPRDPRWVLTLNGSSDLKSSLLVQRFLTRSFLYIIIIISSSPSPSLKLYPHCLA